MTSNNPIVKLASMRLQQLREIASSLGLVRSRTAKSTPAQEIISQAPLTSEVVAPVIVAPSDSPEMAGVYESDAGIAETATPELVGLPVPLAVSVTSGKSRPDRSTPPTVRDDLAAIESEMATPTRPPGETSVVFLPRDPQWAYVFWDICEQDRISAQSSGASLLCLRVADMTGLNGGSSHPHTMQEVVVDSHATEWYLPVPLADRDYRVELGYRKAGGGWISLAFSSVARVPSIQPSEQILDQFVPFSLESETTYGSTTTVPESLNVSDIDLHERLYQSATSRWRRLGRGSEAFHEFEEDSQVSDASGAPGSVSHASGLGLWASGRNSSGIGGVPPRQRAFWLVADAELIVYGATDPAARLTIGAEEVPLSADGTFRIEVPFRDGKQLYPIQAVAADGEQKRSITMEFDRSTPEANVNSLEEALPNWF